jgi:hypothetical protein
VHDLHALLILQVHELHLLDRSWVKKILDNLREFASFNLHKRTQKHFSVNSVFLF